MKNNIKRFISIFLVLATVITVSGSAFAAANNQISNNDYTHALELFQRLGIIEDYDNFSDTKVVTRGYFAMVAARLYNVSVDGIATEQRFTDVPLYSSYADSIEFLATNGVISGDGTGTFRENERIKVTEAAKMLVEIAGYSFIAELNGGYPDGYIAAANEAGILKGIGGTDNYLTAEGMIVMIANMLNAYDIKINIGSKGKTYEKDLERTLLKKIYDVDVIEGVVTQNSLTAFYSASDIGKNKIEITASGEKYVLYTEEYGDFIGKRVKAFYTSDMDDDKIIYAYIVSEKNSVKTLQISDIYPAESTQSSIRYYDADSKRDKTIKGVASPTVLYNKMYYAEGALNFMTALDGKTGTIELIDNNADDEYDIINIRAYDSFIVGNVMLDEKKVYSSSNTYGTKTPIYPYFEFDIDSDNYDDFSMTFEDGTEATILDIVQRHVMSVATSSPSAKKKTIEIIISRNVQSGKITAIDYEDGAGEKCLITLDSREPFETTADVVTNFELTIGKSVSLYIDAFGNVVGTTLVPTGYFRYGLMLGHKLKRDVLTVKLFTADNEVQEFEISPKLYIDGVKYTYPAAASNRLDNVKAEVKTGQDIKVELTEPIKEGIYPVRYLLNDSGQLYKLDTPAKSASVSENDGLVVSDKGGRFAVLYDYIMMEYYVDNPRTIPVSKDATVIRLELNGEPLPGDKTSYENSRYDETSIIVETASELVTGLTDLYCYPYKLKNDSDPDSPYADLVLVVDTTSISSDGYMLMVDKIVDIYDEKEDESLPMLVGISQGAQQSIMVSSIYKQEFKNKNLKKGDTVRVAVSEATGNLVGIEVISQYGINGTTGAEYADIHDSWSGIKISSTQHKRWIYIGYVAERRGELLKILRKKEGQFDLMPDSTEITGTANMLYAQPNASTTVTVFDRASDRVFTGTFDDIKDYVHYGNAASRVIVRYESGSLKEIIVYND